LDKSGEGAGVARQEADCRTLAQVRGWEVHDVIVENDTSAAGKRSRPGFESLLAAVRDGSTQVIIAWALDRLTRNRRDTVQLIEACQEHKIMIALVRGSDMDMSTPSGRMVADILASVARNEIEQKSDRQKRAIQQAAEKGERVSGRRPFGYTADGMELLEPEATAVRDAYAAVLDGASLGEIARRWNEAGLYTPQGHPWRSETAGVCLQKPRNAKLREHHGETFEATWPPLVDRDTWYTVRLIMKDPKRLSRRGDQRLLTGLALCGICSGPVHAGGNKGGASAAYPVYRCANSTGHFSRKAEPVDDYVSEIIIARLSKPDAAELFTSQFPDTKKSELIREADRIRTKLDELAALLEDGTLTAKGVRESSERLRAQLSEVDEKLAEVNGVPKAARTLAAAADVRSAWNALEIPDRREVIRVLAKVFIHPPGRGAREFQPETVQIEWLS
jgi:site-specific DNA recombinase